MAIFKTCNGGHKYFDSDARQIVINYELRPDKAIHKLYGGNVPNVYDAPEIMDNTAEHFKKQYGVMLHHYIVSFEPYEVSDPSVVYEIGQEIASFFYPEYETVFAVHEDKRHLHIHIVTNSVSYTDGHKYLGKRKDYAALKSYITKTLRNYGIYNVNYIYKTK